MKPHWFTDCNSNDTKTETETIQKIPLLKIPKQCYWLCKRVHSDIFKFLPDLTLNKKAITLQPGKRSNHANFIFFKLRMSSWRFSSYSVSRGTEQGIFLRLYVTSFAIAITFFSSFLFTVFSDGLAKVIFYFLSNGYFKHVWPRLKLLIWYVVCFQAIFFRDKQGWWTEARTSGIFLFCN